LVAGLNGLSGVSCLTPPGAFYAFADIMNITNDDAVFAHRLLEETGLATVPGSAFHAPGHIRLSYAAAMPELEEALARLQKFLS
jgi:aspartate aminotransferase